MNILPNLGINRLRTKMLMNESQFSKDKYLNLQFFIIKRYGKTVFLAILTLLQVFCKICEIFEKKMLTS